MPCEKLHYLKEWRQFLRLSQDEIASAVGVTRAAISQLEDSKSVQLSRLHQIAAAMKVEWLELFYAPPTELREFMQKRAPWEGTEKAPLGADPKAVDVAALEKRLTNLELIVKSLVGLAHFKALTQ